MTDDREQPMDRRNNDTVPVDRRKFLRWGSVFGAGATAGCWKDAPLGDTGGAENEEPDPSPTGSVADGTVPETDCFDLVVGTADELKTAVADVSPGDSILVEPGRYELSEPLIIDTDDVTLSGKQYQTTELRNPSTPVLRVVDSHRARLSQLHLNGGGENTSDLLRFETPNGITYRHLVHDVRIGESRGNGVYIGTIHDSTFQQLEVFAVGTESGGTPTWNLKVDAGSEHARANSFIDCRFERSAWNMTGGLADLNGLHQSVFIATKFHAPDRRPTVPLVNVDDCRRTSFATCNFFAGDFGNDAPVTSVIQDEGGNPMRYANCVFWGQAGTHITMGRNKIIIGNGFYHFQDAAIQDATGSSNRNIVTGNLIDGESGSMAIRLGSDAQENVVTNNNFVNVSAPVITGYLDNTIANNVGFDTRDNGQVTLAGDSTSVTVEPELDVDIPGIASVQVVPNDGWIQSSATKYSIEQIEERTDEFTITVDSAPERDLTFVWSIDVGH